MTLLSGCQGEQRIVCRRPGGKRREGKIRRGRREGSDYSGLGESESYSKAANTSMDNVVKTTVYFKRQADKTIREARERCFKKKPPAAILIQVAGFSEEAILVEIDTTAYVP